MDLNKINKNILCLLCMILVFIISLSINSRVYAEDVPSDFEDNINLYKFNLSYPTDYFSSQKKEEELVEKAKTLDEVASGNWYYFVCRSVVTAGYEGEGIILINKSILDREYLKLIYTRYGFGLALTNDTLWSSGTGNVWNNDLIKFIDCTFDTFIYSFDFQWKRLRNESSYSCIPLQCYRTGSSPSYTINVPLATNYEGDIIYFDKDNNKHFLLLNSPYILNTNKELSSLSNDTLYIEEGSYFGEDKILKLYNNTTNTEIFSVNVGNDPYGLAYTKDISDYLGLDVFHFGLAIPFSELPKFHYVEGNSYTWSLSFGENGIYNITIVSSVTGFFGSNSSFDNNNKELLDNQNKNTEKLLESNKETQNKLDEQTDIMKENNETNKNIFQKIGDILSFINPFSENFFGRKLVELIIEGLKSLFVPEEGFFDNYFNEIRQWFSDRLGFLWTPFDFVIEVLNRILTINFSEPVIHIPEIKAPFVDDQVLISEMDYNLNSLKENEIFNNIHNLYLTGVDFIIIVAMINLARKKIEEVFEN